MSGDGSGRIRAGVSLWIGQSGEKDFEGVATSVRVGGGAVGGTG